MTVRYRAVVKTGDWKLRDQIAPHFMLEFSRDSKLAKAEAFERFEKLLKQNRPCEHGYIDIYPGGSISGAHAWLEISGRHGPRALAKYIGVVDERTDTGASSHGRWILRAECEDCGMPGEISA